MIRTLFIIAGAALVLSLACLGGAMALGGADLKRHDWTWTFKDPDGDTVRFERNRTTERGPEVTRTLAWNGTDTLSVEVPAEVTYIQGPDANVVVTGSASVIDRLRIENGRVRLIDGNANVVIGFRDGEFEGWSDVDDLRIVITAPSVTRFDLSGSGGIDIRDYDHPAMRIDIAGSGEVLASGRTQALTVDLSGSGEAELHRLTVGDAVLNVSGSGDITAAPTGRAEIDIAGSGDVFLRGRPAQVVSDISGSGEVRQD